MMPFLSLAVFGRAIHSLARIGDELYVEPLPNGVIIWLEKWPNLDLCKKASINLAHHKDDADTFDILNFCIDSCPFPEENNKSVNCIWVTNCIFKTV